MEKNGECKKKKNWGSGCGLRAHYSIIWDKELLNRMNLIQIPLPGCEPCAVSP